MTTARYVVAACRPAPSINDPDFPADVIVVEAVSRVDALRQARAFFDTMRKPKDWTHLKIVDGPPSESA